MKKILILIMAGAFTLLNAQQGKLDKANKAYDNLGYFKAHTVYLKVAKKGYESKGLLENLGNSFYFNSNYKEAAKWYEKLFNLSKDNEPLYFLRYSQTLKNIGKPNLAKKYYDLFLQKIPKSNFYLSSDSYLARIAYNSNRYTIQPLKINSNSIDFGMSKYNENEFLFTSTRDSMLFSKRKDAWTNDYFMTLYKASIDSIDNTFNVEKLKGINTKNHESSAAITKDGKTIYFTRSSKGYERDVLKLYRAYLIDGVWKNVEELTNLNSDRFSNAHPALSPSNDTLYFVSNRSGGYGLTDIYRARILSDGTIGEAYNLGKPINTNGRESFPFLSENNELFFSSDGHFGLGGYDIFFVDYNKKDIDILNVGEPINSAYDDFYYSIDNHTKKGFFSTNRPSVTDKDNIYSFVENKPLKSFTYLLSGKVIDSITKQNIENSIISLFDIKNEKVAELKTDRNGYYEIQLQGNRNYIVRSEKTDYISKEKNVFLIGKKQLDFTLNKNKININVGDDIAALLNLNVIYFDLDNYNLRTDAEIALQQIIAVLEQNPKLKIEISSHTDSQGNDQYNAILSRKRAEATKAYFIANGIDENRLTAKGYGESQLMNNCNNTRKCLDSEHQLNRRSEFRVKID